MHIVVNPVLSVGFKNGDKPSILPLMHVVLYRNKAKWKEHLVNYTFGKKGVGNNIDFENELGEIKAALFSHLDPVPTGQVELHYYRQGQNIEKKIIRDLKAAPDKRPLLFVWEKKISDETPFYKALGVEPKNIVNLGVKMTKLSDLGLSLKHPYEEFDLEQEQS